MNYLSTNIKFLRVSKKITQEELAKIVNKSRVTICHWEADEREICVEDIIKLSDYFNIPMNILVGKDLRFNDNKEITFNQNEINFDKYKHILSESDWYIINAIIEQRKKEVEKENGNV